MWAQVSANGFTAGKTLRFPGGGGSPDAEGVTQADPSSSLVYVASERDNNVGATSRNSILLFDSGDASTTVSALNEWLLTTTLPSVGPNLGIEAITFVPDTHLLASGFYDERTSATYDPSLYPDHQGGLFFVGLEANGRIYAYALDHTTSAASLVASFASGNVAVMALEFDVDSGYLWAGCDNTCNGQLTVLQIEQNPLATARGRFQVRRTLDRPSTMPNLNNEGISIAPDSHCSGARKSFYWTDDGETAGHALRRDTIPCGAFL